MSNRRFVTIVIGGLLVAILFNVFLAHRDNDNEMKQAMRYTVQHCIDRQNADMAIRQ